jgi:hypothetical protein
MEDPTEIFDSNKINLIRSLKKRLSESHKLIPEDNNNQDDEDQTSRKAIIHSQLTRILYKSYFAKAIATSIK